MKFLLNKDKSSMLMVGNTVFTFDDPGPKEIDLDTIDHGLVKQLIYNCRRGLLACGDPEALLAKEITPIPRLATDHERPIPKRVPIKPSDEPTEEDIKPLKKLLKSSVATIKKELASLPPGRIRKLKELEMQGKWRKSLLAEMDRMIEKHTRDAKAAVGAMDVGGKVHAPGMTGSPNVSDIVESEEKEVEVNAPNHRNVAADIVEGC